jgi:hypothetical protein
MANKAQTLETPRAPSLPLPDQSYNHTTQDQHNSSLRNFFLKLQSVLSNLLGPNGGQYIDSPNGLFFSTSDQTLVATNTAKAVLFPIQYLNNGVKVNAGTSSRIYVSVSGIYNFQFSGQLVSSSSSAKQVYLWIVRNGTDIGYSTHQYTLSGSSVHLNVGWNFNIDMQAGDYLELEWAADSTSVTMEATAAAGAHPGIPSAVMAVNYVAPLPDVIPTPP